MRPQKSLSRRSVIVSSVLVIIGGLAQLYVIIIGGQAYPLILFPGMIEESSFFDGVINNYVPSFPELGLGIGGIAISAILVVIGTKILRFLPVSLADSEMDPNNKPLETEPTK